MKFVSLDFETYYDKDYSLKKMSTRDYIMDDRFEATCVALRKQDQDAAFVIPGQLCEEWFGRMNWDDIALVCHNSIFDAAILAWRYNVKPAFYIDTMSMANYVVHSKTGSVGLNACAKFYGLPEKPDGAAALSNTMGRYRKDLTTEEFKALCDYNKHDAWVTMELFKLMVVGFPTDELKLMDMGIRMWCQGKLKLGGKKLIEYLNELKQEEKDVLLAAGNPQ